MTLTAPLVQPLADLAATQDLAARLAALAGPGDVIALIGDLGAGKTEFARAFIRALTAPDEDVPSPTFTLVQTYPADAFDIWHFDLYRLDAPEDAFELDIEDAFHDAVSLIEWPERLGAYLPRERLDIVLSVDSAGNMRTAELIAHGGWAARLEDAFDDPA